VLHAPLTGIFLIAEISGGYALFVPLMLVSATSYFVAKYFEPNSIYTKTLIERGLINKDKDVDVLSEMSIESIIENNFSVINVNDTLRNLVGVIAVSKRNIFAVVDDEYKLEGIIMMDDVREVMFNTHLYDQTLIKELMNIPPFIANVNEKMDVLMNKFEEYAVWNIPVVDEEERYVGFISKSGVLDKYREKLIVQKEEVI
jgi:CIC family chloride channel protein